MLTRGGQRTSKVQWGEPSKYKAGKAGPVHGVAQVAVEWGGLPRWGPGVRAWGVCVSLRGCGGGAGDQLT